MLQLTGVSKSYSGKTVLHPTDLQIPAGETTVLIGPSGCGKSTLLRLMIGLIPPDTGSVRFQQQEVNTKTVLTLRQKMGYVIQEGGLFPHLTAERNVSLMARHLDWEQKRVQTRIQELRELTHLAEDVLQRFPAQLSGGQRQRVSLMRALMLDPDLLLLDEPLGSLDPMIRAELQSELREIFRSLAKTVVMVTHDMGEAAYFGNSIVLLREGRVVQQGTLDDLLKSPADPFVTLFIQAQRSHLETLSGESA